MADLIASEEDLQKFGSAQPGQRQLTPALKGVAAEIATSGTLRYPWDLLKPLLAELLEQALLDFEAEAHVEVGPSPAGTTPEAAKQLRKRLGELLAGCTRGAPFTLQRFAELLLEPRKQYSRLDKLALALEKLLMVVSIQQPDASPPPRPRLSSLAPVNENPEPPEPPSSDGNTAREQPRSPRANGALANGGDDVARAGFSSQMHAAAETAFINSVLVPDGGGADTGPGTATEASPMQADSSGGSPASAAAVSEAATAAAASSAAAATGSADAAAQPNATPDQGGASQASATASSEKQQERTSEDAAAGATDESAASQAQASSADVAVPATEAAAAPVDASGDMVMTDAGARGQVQSGEQAAEPAVQQTPNASDGSLSCGEDMQQ